MQKAALRFASVVIVCLAGPGPGWNFGPRVALGDQIKFDMPKEMTGFHGDLAGKVLEVKPPDQWSSSGWIAIGEIKVLTADKGSKASPESLTAAWQGKNSNIGAKDMTVKAPPEVKVGDWMLAECFQHEGHLRATKLAFYAPGEEEPNGYLFVKKMENGGKVSLLLMKLFQESTVPLPMKIGSDGKPGPQADLLVAVNALKENTGVAVELEHGVLKSIKPYTPPKRVEFVKMINQKVEADTTTKPAVTAHVLVGMEVKDNGTSVTIMIDPKDKEARAKASKIGTFKPGQFLLIHSTEDEKGVWLESAKADPNQEKSGNAPSKP